MSKIQSSSTSEKETVKKPALEYRSDWFYAGRGFHEEREYFIENLSLLVSSGMDILASIAAISSSFKTKRMKNIVLYIEKSITSGFPLWQAFEKTELFPSRTIALLRSGEETGRLPEHLNLITLQLHKEKVLKSRILSALIYPAIILMLAFVVALGSAWYILPNLVSIFNEAQGTMPLATKILLSLGMFLRTYGIIVVPGMIIFTALVVYILFVNKRFRFIGDAILFRIPGINTLLRGVELARFTYIFGVLIQSGFQVSEALESVKDGTVYLSYRKFYNHIQDNIEKGESFQTTFSSYPHSDRYIPQPIQQLIISAEKSGRLPDTFIKISGIFEEKTEVMSKDLATILEPTVLVVVGLIVGFVVIAITSPIYDLSNQL